MKISTVMKISSAALAAALVAAALVVPRAHAAPYAGLAGVYGGNAFSAMANVVPATNAQSALAVGP